MIDGSKPKPRYHYRSEDHTSKKKGTKSSVSEEKQPLDIVAGQPSEKVVQPTVQQQTKASTSRMSESELGSVVEYSEDVSAQEAPVPLPKRDYPAQIKSAKPKKSQRDTLYAEVEFYISPDAYPADYTEGDPDGLKIYYRRVSLEDKPQARFRLRQFCEAIGAPMSKRIDLNEWVGLNATVKVDHETFEGITRNVIQAVTPS